MPQPTFADVDTTQSDLMQKIVADVSQRYVQTKTLEGQVKQDQADKIYSHGILDSYIAAHNPRKENRVHPLTGEKEVVEKYPTVDETFRLATQARAALAQSGGRHSVFASDQIGKDLDARMKYSQRSSKADELQEFINIYGPEEGLTRFGQAQTARKVAPVEAANVGKLDVAKTNIAGKKELSAIDFDHKLKLTAVKAEKAFSPVELDDGNLAIAWENPMTHEAGVYNLGVKGGKLGAKGGGGGMKVTTNEWFKVWQPVVDAEMRAVSMFHSEQEANAGKNKGPNDTNLLFNHMGMTLSAQKGTRITYAEIENAIKARSFPEDIMVAWDRVSKGGSLSPQQRKAFVELAMKRRIDFIKAARRTAKAIKMDKSSEPHFNEELPKITNEGEDEAGAGAAGGPGAAPAFQLKGEKGAYNWDAEDSEFFKKEKGHYPTQQEAEAEAKAGGHL